MKLKSVLIGSAAMGALAMAAPAYADNTYVSFFGGISSVDGDDLRIGPFTYSDTAGSAFNGTIGVNSGSGTLKFGTAGNGYVGIQGPGYFRKLGSGTRYAVTYANPFQEDEFDSGFVVGAAIGRDFDDGWRAELEIAWRSNDMGEVNPVSGTHASQRRLAFNSSGSGNLNFYNSGGTKTYSGSFLFSSVFTDTEFLTLTKSASFTATANGSGDVTSFAVMANVWYDFDMGGGTPIKPFVGAGIGAVNLGVEYSGGAVLPANTVGILTSIGTFQNTVSFATDTDDWTWGWQAAAGLSYEFAGGMRLSAQYRYFSTGDIDVLGQDFSVSSHEGLIGLHIPLGN